MLRVNLARSKPKNIRMLCASFTATKLLGQRHERAESRASPNTFTRWREQVGSVPGRARVPGYQHGSGSGGEVKLLGLCSVLKKRPAYGG